MKENAELMTRKCFQIIKYQKYVFQRHDKNKTEKTDIKYEKQTLTVGKKGRKTNRITSKPIRF